MTTFFEASQARLILKMKLSNYAWYNDSCVVTDDEEDFAVLIGVSKINQKVRKIIPKKLNDVFIRLKIN